VPVPRKACFLRDVGQEKVILTVIIERIHICAILADFSSLNTTTAFPSHFSAATNFPSPVGMVGNHDPVRVGRHFGAYAFWSGSRGLKQPIIPIFSQRLSGTSARSWVVSTCGPTPVATCALVIDSLTVCVQIGVPYHSILSAMSSEGISLTDGQYRSVITGSSGFYPIP
jgi:hypothetical protein